MRRRACRPPVPPRSAPRQRPTAAACSRSISDRANGSNSRSASGRPRHSDSASRRIVDACCRVAAPERLSASAQQPLKLLQVELTLLDAQQIPGRASDQSGLVAVDGERLAQPGDLNAQQPLGGIGRLVAQQLVEKTVAGHDPVGVAQQQREQRPLPRSANRHAHTIAPHLKRPQDLEFQTRAHGPCR